MDLTLAGSWAGILDGGSELRRREEDLSRREGDGRVSFEEW